MKTPSPDRMRRLSKKWFLMDADGKVLGKVAAKVASILRGKHKVDFAPHVDMGDHVIVVNVDKIQFTGNKLEKKKYYSHSGYPGSLTVIPLKRMVSEKPFAVLQQAVSGMLPKNKLRKPMLSKLHLYIGAEHEHKAQKPEVLDLP